jgi:hypothetical protein
MKVLFGIHGWGWRLFGLLGTHARWFAGFSQALPREEAPPPNPVPPQVAEDWYTEDQGVHCIDFDQDSSNQLSFGLLPDGRACFAAYTPEVRLHGPVFDTSQRLTHDFRKAIKLFADRLESTP